MNGYAYSYYFSKYHWIWGWATWQRAWRCYDDTMKLYPEYSDYIFKSLSPSRVFSDRWKGALDLVYHRTFDTWDYVWMFSCWANSGLTCTPRVNLSKFEIVRDDLKKRAAALAVLNRRAAQIGEQLSRR
jgi:hypothetical protein